MKGSELTSAEWWDAYWAGIELPIVVDQSIRWQAALAEALREELPAGGGRRLLEIGCAPGRWLAWFARELGYGVAGCDNSPHGMALTRANLRLLGVDAALYETDFLAETVPGAPYDVVLSLGVVEHFDDPQEVIRRHAELVRPGGILVVEVPNLRGSVNSALLKALGMNDLISHHNVEMMDPSSLRQAATDIGLRVRCVRFVGGFDLTLALGNVSAVAGPEPIRRRLLLPLLWRARGRGARTGRQSRLWSHLLLGVFEKPGDA